MLINLFNILSTDDRSFKNSYSVIVIKAIQMHVL